jgi:hypothetical protein
MSTINGCGTMFYGSDYNYHNKGTKPRFAENKLDEVEMKKLIQIVMDSDPRIIRLKKRKEELDNRLKELSYVEYEELRKINPQIEAIRKSYFTNHEHELTNPFQGDSYVATKWFVIFMLPIFPIESVRIHGYSPVTSAKGGRWQTTQYNTTEVPLHLTQVIKTYLLVYGVIALLLLVGYMLGI